jgi:glutamyl-tRNA synthetase
LTVLVTRFAPTPSGYLHTGNVVNLVLTHWLVRTRGGRLLLRIDDFDVARTREAYLTDVFRTLDWLEIHVDDGPSGPQDFHDRWSMTQQLDRFVAARDQLMASSSGQVFVCGCSRPELGPGRRCVAGCREQALPLESGRSALRISIPPGAARGLPLPPGDHVLWRRDGTPAYQLGSVVADDDLGVTTIVRGIDLLESSALQVHLAAALPAPGFVTADLRHHGLVTSAEGTKLSKSAGAQAHPIEHTRALHDQVLAHAERLGPSIGITRP